MTPFRTLVAASLLAGGIAVAAPATAQQITASNPQSVANALVATGYRAELTTSPSGDPMIKSATNGIDFRIFFFGCTGGKACDSIQFFLGFTDPVVSTDRINEWNRDHRYGRAYIDKEGDPVVEMDVDLDKGGISRALFDDYVATWGQVGATFRTFVTE